MTWCGFYDKVNPRCSYWFTAGVIAVYTNPMSRKMSRIAWSLLRHPVKSRGFPAKHERLVTADELLRFGV